MVRGEGLGLLWNNPHTAYLILKEVIIQMITMNKNAFKKIEIAISTPFFNVTLLQVYSTFKKKR